MAFAHSRDHVTTCLVASGALILLATSTAHGQISRPDQMGYANAGAQSEDRIVADHAAFYRPQCGQPRNRDDAVYCVELRAAEAAEKQAEWAHDQTIIGTVGIFGIVGTLVFTAWAAASAAKAATASARVTDISRLALERERARLHVNVDTSTGLFRGAPTIIRLAFLSVKAPANSNESSVWTQMATALPSYMIRALPPIGL